MRRVQLLTVSLFWVIACFVLAQSQSPQTVKAVLLGDIVEFVANEEAPGVVLIKSASGQLLKRMRASDVRSLAVVATFNSYEGDFVLLRTSMGQGACAGGDLYSLRFQENETRRGQVSSVSVSPVLTTCLGEWPPVKFTYNSRGDLVISVSGYALRGPAWNRWTKEKR